MRALAALATTVLLVSATIVAVDAAPARATPLWSIEPSTSPRTNLGATLTDVTCRGTANCFAVGYYQAGDRSQPLIEHWDGTGWTIMPTPEPPRFSLLMGVACDSDTSCFAVGGQPFQTVSRPLIEHWNGQTWSLMPWVGVFGSLSDIKCPGPNNCFAVGQNRGKTLIEHWMGIRWNRMPTPSPVKALGTDLNAIACPTSTNCVAVGDAAYFRIDRDGVRDDRYQTVAAHWNGGAWTIVASRNILYNNSFLDGVTCPGVSNCYAVGYGGHDSLLTHWNGSTWERVTFAQPAHQSMSLEDVACHTAQLCFAIGMLRQGSEQLPVIQRWNGKSWTTMSGPRPPTFPALTSVFCPTSDQCFAVGEVTNNSRETRTLGERWNGATWNLTAVQTPQVPAGTVQAVTCTSSTNCLAVGPALRTTTGVLVAHSNGSAWTLTPVPSPPLANGQVVLDSVACATATNCFAVGVYQFPEGFLQHTRSRPLLEHWDGANWSVVTEPLPAGADGYLFDVTCPDATNCFAVGSTTVVSGGSFVINTLIVHWDGTTWTTMTSPHVSAPPELHGVTCRTNTNCYAVGGGRYSAETETLIEHWNGTTWSVMPSPTPAGIAELEDVACPSDTSCFAVGDNNGLPFIEQWDGMNWTIVSSPSFVGAQPDPALSDIACPSVSNCFAVGSRYDTARPAIEQWDGLGWTLAPIPDSGNNSRLFGVTCVSDTLCLAVGWTGAGDGVSVLVERYS